MSSNIKHDSSNMKRRYVNISQDCKIKFIYLVSKSPFKLSDGPSISKNFSSRRNNNIRSSHSQSARNSSNLNGMNKNEKKKSNKLKSKI